jgi:hypothetical protein
MTDLLQRPKGPVRIPRYQWHPQQSTHAGQSNGASHLGHKAALRGFLRREAWASMEPSASTTNQVTFHRPLKTARRSSGTHSEPAPRVSE